MGRRGGDALPARLHHHRSADDRHRDLEALLDSLQIGGSAQDIDGMRTLLRSAAVDPYAAQLLAGFLRGDRSQSAELAAFLLAGRRRIRP